MPNALQCPSCGHRHRLSTLSGEPMFRCESCDRVLKTPEQYQRPQPDRGSDRAASAPSGTARTAAAKAEVGKAGAARRRKRPVVLAVPFVLAVWVASIAVSGIIVLILGRKFGWLSKDRIWDLLTGSGMGRYLRVLVIVPVWALLAAALVTAALEGLRRLARRHDAPAARRATRPAPIPAAKTTAKNGTAKNGTAKNGAPKTAAPAAKPQPKPTPTPEPAPAGAAGPRPRRIPRRDIAT